MLHQAFTALLSHWRYRPWQLAMLLLGLALATALWSAVQAINGEARASYARAAAVIGQDRFHSLARPDGGRFSETVYVDLRRAGWLLSPVLEGEKRIGGARIRILGVDPLSMPPGASDVDVVRGPIGLESFITPPGVLVVSPETARRLSGPDVPPLRVADQLPPGMVLTDIGIAQELLGERGRISRLILWPEQLPSARPLANVAPGLVQKPPAVETDLSRLTDSFHLNLTAFGFLSFAVGLFIVYSAIGLAFEQRRPMFRTMRALGLPLGSLVFLLCAELLTVSAVAGMAGVALGYAVASLLLPDVAATLGGLYGADVPGTLTIRPSVWLLGLMIAIAGSLGSAATQIWRIVRMPLLAPARPRAWSLASERSVGLQAVGGLAMLLVAMLVVAWGSGLVAGFMALASMLLGAALLLPLVLSRLLGLGRRMAKGAVAYWFWSDTRQQLPGLSLALMALLLALAANMGVGTMVESFRLTFTGWLDQRLASELYVTARSETEASDVRDWLRERSDAVLPIWNAETVLFDQPVQVYGVADHPTYRDHWPMLQMMPGAWDVIAQGKGVFVNEQLARRVPLGVGDMVTLDGARVLPVAGVFSDYGNPKGQIMVATDVLTSLYPDASRLRYAVRVAPDKAGALASELRAHFDLPVENVINNATVKAFSLRIFERTFAVTAALNVLTLGVAFLAILASLLTLSAMRLPQLAPAWSMGMTLRRLAVLEVLRSMALALFTFAAALPVGLALAWMLLAVINVEAFGWRLPMYLFPLDWVRLLILALASAGVAALIPAWRLSKLAPAELVKVFAHDR